MRRAAFFVVLLLVSALFQVPLQIMGAGPARAAAPAAGHYFPLPVAAKVADETVAANSSVTVKVRGSGGIPDSADVSAVAGNIVEFSPAAKGKVYVYPAGGDRPAGGQSYFPAGASSADFTVTRLSADGKITIQNGTSASLRIGFNAQGYYTNAPTGTAGDNGDTYRPLTPARVMDTRDGTGGVAATPVASKSALVFHIAGTGGLPDTGVGPVAIAVTVRDATAAGQWWWCYTNGGAFPAWAQGATVKGGHGKTVTVVVTPSADGDIKFYNGSASSAMDFTVDLMGEYLPSTSTAAGGAFHPVAPARILATSAGTGVPAAGPVAGGDTVTLQVDGRGGIPTGGVAAVAMSVWTNKGTDTGGNIIAYTTGTTRPKTVTVEYAGATAQGNHVMVAPAADGTVSIANRSDGATDLYADIYGYWTTPTKPGKPTSVKATAADGAAHVTWQAPGDGGATITGYTITADPGGATTTTGGTSTDVAGLSNGTAYTFTVTATNAVGTSAGSDPSAAVTPESPDTPTITSVFSHDQGVDITWSPPGNGTGDLDGYTITADPGDITVDAPADATEKLVAGLTNGTRYTFTITANNTDGTNHTSPISPPVAPRDIPHGLNYVALGDSYSSGEGNPPFNKGTNGNGDYCHRSKDAYPYSVQEAYQTAQIGEGAGFYACSGATSVEMQHTYYTEGPQLEEPGVDPSANLVTVTAGGDDAGFSSVLKACILQRFKAEVGSVTNVGTWLRLGSDSSCAHSSDFTSSAEGQVSGVLGPLKTFYVNARNATDSTHTSIVAADYPRLFPTSKDNQRCWKLLPLLSADDQDWMNQEAVHLDTVVATAAAEAGVNIVDVKNEFASHGVCGSKGAWLNGLSIRSGSGSGRLPVVGSFHPNAFGHKGGYAEAIEDYINGSTDFTPEGLPANPAPRTPAIAEKMRKAADTTQADSIARLRVIPNGLARCEGAIRPGERVHVTGSGFAPSTTVTVYSTSPGQDSVEQKIGSVTADDNGQVDTVVAIPLGATGFPSDGGGGAAAAIRPNADIGTGVGNLIGLDAIGLGANGTTHRDATAMMWLAAPGSTCGGMGSLAGGGDFSLAVKPDGTVWAAGENFAGQLGDGTATGQGPVTVAGLSNVAEVAAGYATSYALTRGGDVYAWGSDGYGQLGVGGNGANATAPVGVGGLSDVVQVASGGVDALALRRDGTVAAWGANEAGQLGDGTTTDRTSPVTVPGLSHVVQIAAGGGSYWRGLSADDGYSVALKDDGTVWTWGYGGHGELGLGTLTSTPTPTQVPGLDNVVQVAAGYDSTYALKADGTVYVWGGTDDGQIDSSDGGPYQATPRKKPGIGNVAVIAARGNYAAVIKVDGTVWSWGLIDTETSVSDGTDPCGDGSACATPTQAIGSNDAASIAGGPNHILAETASGTVYAWGNNTSGELASDVGSTTNAPTLVPGLIAEH